MSVVNLIVTDIFALIMSDTKLNDNQNQDTIHKIFKKEEILLGCTGTLKDIREYLHPILTNDFVLNNNYSWGSPTEFFAVLDQKFDQAINSNTEKDIIFVAAAKIGDKYVAKYYCLLNSKGHQPKTETLISDGKIQYFYLGDKSHKKYFRQKFDDVASVTKEDLIDMFQDTLNYGVQYDDTINNRMEWECV